ncbi:hypothetical protein [Oceanidesulfovibrio marinus]|uniref:Uncharacterized protein n=1 Tax=Oceanidesulfovibrio marinus TaxID=370038 RepID=A0A6P1ZFN2_9BACT|nr:hypothetical protein [Oceanidesulfovibrio marinus]TVM31220.1 hypothetical protein DQK91_19110 [Oceanidesulfovibrio marinus]
MRGPVYTANPRGLAHFFVGASESYIYGLLKKYEIPKCGPDGRFISHDVLEEFVANPEDFLPLKKHRRAAPILRSEFRR